MYQEQDNRIFATGKEYNYLTFPPKSTKVQPMKKTYPQILKSRLKALSPDLFKCLCGTTYRWQPRERALELMNALLKDIPDEAWPEDRRDFEEYAGASYKDWGLSLFWDEGKRNANLGNCKDDHTAWVEEDPMNKGVFLDSDIGGS